MWENIKTILQKNNIKTNSLSPTLVTNNETLLPHIREELSEEVVKMIMQNLSIEIFDITNEENIKQITKQNSSYIIYNAQAYATNPFSSTEQQKIQVSQDFPDGDDVNFTLGYINPSFFTKNQKIDFNPNENISKLFEKAIQLGVSDVHIYPRNNKNIGILFRSQGEIVESGIADVGIDKYSEFANKLLSLAHKNAGDYVNYIESQFDYTENNLNLSVRLQQNPSIFKFSDGKHIPSYVLRVHNNSGNHQFKELKEMGFAKDQSNLLTRISRHNSGIIIVTGPTGSGKTTALYAILNEAIKHRNRIVQTIEDPVEITIPGIKQTNIDIKQGVTYANSIKAILRSDVDIALIGEIRDRDTAHGVIELKRVGHLVLATTHTDTSFNVLSRLKDFGVSSEHIADSLRAIVSTRLVKQVCQDCSTEHIVEDMNPPIDSKYAKYITLTDKVRVANKEGCKNCLQGYSGRLMVAEVVLLDPVMLDLITKGISVNELIKQHTSHQNKTIWEHGFELVKRGKTTLEALELVLPTFTSYGSNYSANEFDRV